MRTARSRRGVAMVAALFLVVVISAAVLDFALEAQERQQLGIAAADRGWGQGATLGALAKLQAELDQQLVNVTAGGYNQQTRAADAWLDADSIYSGPIAIDSTTVVDVQVADLGAYFNINTATEVQLNTFLGYLLDAQTISDLTPAILDWRDADSNRRVGGAEVQDYLDDGLLALPANGPFREPGDLLMVAGMTPDIYAVIAPYITTYGTGTINVNTAPDAVLWGITGMTQEIYNNILAGRSRGLRITSMAAVAPNGGNLNGAAVQSTQLMLNFVARQSETSAPVKMRALATRAGTTVTIGWKQW